MEDNLHKEDEQTEISANNAFVENLEPEAKELKEQNVIDDKKNKSLEIKIGLLSLCILVVVVLHIFSIIAYCIWNKFYFILMWILSVPLFFIITSVSQKLENKYKDINGHSIFENKEKQQAKQVLETNGEVFCSKRDIENLLKNITESDTCPICKLCGENTEIIKKECYLSKRVKEKRMVDGVYTAVSSLGQVHQAYQYVDTIKFFPAVKYHCPVCEYDFYEGKAEDLFFDEYDYQPISYTIRKLDKGKLYTPAYNQLMKCKDFKKLERDDKLYAYLDDNATFIDKKF